MSYYDWKKTACNTNRNSKVKIRSLNTDLKNRDDFLKELKKNTVKQMDRLVEHVKIMDEQMEDMSKEFKFIYRELNILSSATNLHRDHGGMRSDYQGGGVVLNTIKSGVNFIIRKLVEYISVGLTSILLLE